MENAAVFYLEKISTKSNNFGIDREEVWSFSQKTVFENIEEARLYVIRMNKTTSEYALWAEQFAFKPSKEKIDEFCFVIQKFTC